MVAKVFLIGLVAAVVMGLSSASAGYFDGNKLNWCCSSPAGSPPEAECYGYVAGVADTNSGFSGGAYCMSTEVKLTQLVDSVKLYLRDHPEERHLLASDLVTSALSEKFPCHSP
jgi:hypothetical protein